jgi:hypothetical protein
MSANKNNNPKQPESLLLVPQSFLETITEGQKEIIELLGKMNSGENSLGDYISETEAKKLLGRKTTWFWNMRNSGQIPFTKVGNKIYYSKQDIVKLLDGNKNSSNSNV